MAYPVQILPNSNYKFINCHVGDCVLMRTTGSPNDEDIWDNELQQIRVAQLANPRERVYDMSTNLLGVFERDHCKIYFTQIGKEKYGISCEPDTEVENPKEIIDFLRRVNVGIIYAKIEDVAGIKVTYTSGDSKNPITYYGESFVKHTPMRWNFWHYSIDWKISIKSTSSDEYETVPQERLTNGMLKQIASAARSRLVEKFSLACDSYNILDESCYMKDTALPQQVT